MLLEITQIFLSNSTSFLSKRPQGTRCDRRIERRTDHTTVTSVAVAVIADAFDQLPFQLKCF